MYKIIESPGHIEGRKTGHPSIFFDGSLHEEACNWLNQNIIPYSNSRNTWMQAARSVVSWLEYCNEIEIDFLLAGRDDFINYRDAYLFSISPNTGRKYSPNTLRVRMTYIASFMDFSAGEDWNSASSRGPGKSATQIPNRSTVKAASSYRGASRRLIPRATQDDTIRVLRRSELQLLLNWAGPRASERARDDDHGSERNRVLFDLAWGVGLRSAEIRSLLASSFERIAPDKAHPGEMFQFSVRGKGGKNRKVDIPAWLVIDIQSYMKSERRRCIRRIPNGVDHGYLIVNSEKSRNRAGFAMTSGGVEAIMVRACKDLDLMTTFVWTSSDNGMRKVALRPSFSLHCLRHTYAVLTYHHHKISGLKDIESWKYIQIQLGHNSPETTMKFYLRHVSVWSQSNTSHTIMDML